MVPAAGRGKERFVCQHCNEDPLKSPKLRKLIRSMKPPEDEPQDPPAE